MQYLYETQQQRTQTGKAAVRQQQQQQRPGSPVLAMAPLPQIDDASRDWGPAQGNLETAKMALDALRSLIMDAVFLDEEAYTNSATLQLYQQRLQAQQRRILQLEGEVEALRVESGRQQEALVQQRAQTRAAEACIQELQQELDNNAVVFDMHYNELLLKGEEIERLKSVIEGLGGTG